MNETYNFGFDLPIQTTENNNRDEMLQSFVQYKNDNAILEIQFSTADELGNLSVYMQGVRIVLPNNHATNDGKHYDPRQRHNKLFTALNVKIIDIDMDNAVVTVSYFEVARVQRQEVRRQILQQLKYNEENPTDAKPIVVPARVIDIERNGRGVYVDICGFHIRGYVPISLWGYKYLHDPKNEIEKGMNTTVSILRKNGAQQQFLCDRKSTIANPWIGIEERYPLKSTLVVTCEEKVDRNWFGKMQGEEEIRVYCEYPDSSNHGENVHIVVGKKYMCYVYKVNEEAQLLRARAFKEII